MPFPMFKISYPFKSLLDFYPHLTQFSTDDLRLHSRVADILLNSGDKQSEEKVGNTSDTLTHLEVS